MTMSQRMRMREHERRRKERLRRARRRRNCAITVIVLAALAVAVIIWSADNGGGNDNSSSPQATADVTAKPSDTYTTELTAEDLDGDFYENSAFFGNAVADTIAMYGVLTDADFYAYVNADLDNAYSKHNGKTSIANQIRNKKFDKVFLSFGEKELAWEDADEFYSSYETLVTKLLEKQPECEVYLIGIPPITSDASDNGEDGMNMDNIDEYNNEIKRIAADNEVYYIDSVDALSNGKGYLPEKISSDGISLNKAAVIELLCYAQENAFIPDESDVKTLSGDDTDSERNANADKSNKSDKTEKATQTPKPSESPKPTSKTKTDADEPTASPEPTVNVLKKSVTDKAEKGE